MSAICNFFSNNIKLNSLSIGLTTRFNLIQLQKALVLTFTYFLQNTAENLQQF